MKQKELFPWDDVDIERSRKWVQKRHSLEDAKREYLPGAASCPQCKASPDQLSWVYYRVPMRLLPRHWRKHGWLTVCDQCKLQIDFFPWKQAIFPWEAVNGARNNIDLQSQFSPDEAKSRYLRDSLPCPRCQTTGSELSWVYYQARWEKKAGWLTICDQCNIQVEFFLEYQEFYPWDTVNACRNNEELQRKQLLSCQSADQAKHRYSQDAMPCVKCRTPAEQLAWFYFVSPKQTWQVLAGRGGWMTVCGECHIQVDFFVEILS